MAINVIIGTGLKGGAPDAHAPSHLPSGTDPLATATPVDIGAANAEGTAESFARSDHVHDGGAGGGPHAATHLPSGTDPLATATPVAVGVANAEGTAESFARSDHVHDGSGAPDAHAASHLPAGTDPLTTAAAVSTGTANAEGTAESFARSDHVHEIAGSLGTGATQAAAGDDARLSDDRTASGLRSATTVVGVSGAAEPTVGQVLTATSGTDATWQAGGGGLLARQPVSVRGVTLLPAITNTVAPGDVMAELSVAYTPVDEVNNDIYVRYFSRTTLSNNNGRGFSTVTVDGVELDTNARMEVHSPQGGGNPGALCMEAFIPAGTLAAGARVIATRAWVSVGTLNLSGNGRIMTITEYKP